MEWEPHAIPGILPSGLDFYDKGGLRRNYGFRIRMPSGRWRWNFIPREIAGMPAFQNFLQESRSVVQNGESFNSALTHPQFRKTKQDDLQLLNWMALSGKDLETLLYALFVSTLPNDFEVDIRRKEGAHPLLPQSLSSDWRGESWSHLEAVSEGHFLTYASAKLWLKTLAREVLDQSPDELESSHVIHKMRGHLWFSLDFDQIPPNQKLDFYQFFINAFGDLNDFSFLMHYPRLNYTGEASQRRAIEAAREVFDFFHQTFIRPLTREMHSRLSASKRGILLEPRNDDLYSEADPGFPSDFKYLYTGLRSKLPGQGPYRHGESIPRIALELRSGPFGILDQAVFLPGRYTSDMVTLKDFARYAAPGPRGILSSKKALRLRSRLLGIRQDSLEEVLKDLDWRAKDCKVRRWRWTADQIRAQILWPFTNWLEHPQIVAYLKTLPSEMRNHFMENYNLALTNYIGGWNSILNSKAIRKRRETAIRARDSDSPIFSLLQGEGWAFQLAGHFLDHSYLSEIFMDAMLAGSGIRRAIVHPTGE